MTMGMGWTDERVERLKLLWADGLSASQIADELGRITRNAVISKVHRLNLSGRVVKKPKPRPPVFKRKLRTKPVAAAPVPIALEPPPSSAVTFMQLGPDHCKWIIGDPAAEHTVYCGGDRMTGLPYCLYHTRAAWRRPGSTE